MFKKKSKLKVDLKKKEMSLNKIVSIEELYGLIIHYFAMLEEEPPIDLSIILDGVTAFTIKFLDGWSLSKKTTSMFNQKVNKRFKRVTTATPEEVISRYIRA